jgi:hypothetical protein
VSKSTPWSAHSFLNALCPPQGWRVQSAVLASYSADPVVLTAAILALSDKADEAGRGSRAARVEALTALRGRLRFLLQQGRMRVPDRPSPALALLDRYVRYVRADEEYHSWHPKIALVVFEPIPERGNEETPDPQKVQVCLWIGSRNLSTDVSWDLGMVMVGRPGAVEDAGAPAGLEDLGRNLWAEAALPDGELPDLSKLVWELPPDVEGIEEVRLLALDATRTLPDLGADADTVWVVSPFLDAHTLRQIKTTPCSRRMLLTTRAAAAEVFASDPGAIKDFHLRVLEPPRDEQVCETDEVASSAEDEPQAEDGAPPLDSWSLHAKAILAVDSGGADLWLGSPNLTRRAWLGSGRGHSNAEAYAHLRVGSEFVAELEYLVEHHARVLDPQTLSAPDEQSAEEKALEKAHGWVAARWKVHQEQRGEEAALLAIAPPHPAKTEIELRVRPFGRVTARGWQPWPRGQESVVLVCPWLEASELVEVELSLGSLARRWVARAPFVDGPPAGRDERVLAQWLGLRGFLAWIRSLLLGEDVAEDDQDPDDPGDGSNPRSRGGRRIDLEGLAPSLEEVLRAWRRQGAQAVSDAHREVERYAQALREHLDEVERQALDEFLGHWRTIVSGLGVEVS